MPHTCDFYVPSCTPGTEHVVCSTATRRRELKSAGFEADPRLRAQQAPPPHDVGINVGQYILDHVTPYEGDGSFLAGPTERTKALLDTVQRLCIKEREKVRACKKLAGLHLVVAV